MVLPITSPAPAGPRSAPAPPHRAVSGAAPLMAANASLLYVSEGALQAAKALKLRYQATGSVARSELPEGWTLVLGDQTGIPEARSALRAAAIVAPTPPPEAGPSPPRSLKGRVGRAVEP